MNSSKRRKKKSWSIAAIIPQLSPLRWCFIAVLTVATLALAYQSMAFSIAMVTRRTNPDLALSYYPNEPVALATKADQLFLKSQDPKTLVEVERLARASVRAQALNPTAIRILGYVADARGQEKKARELILLSEKLSRREFGAQLWLIEDAAARNDIPEALRHYDIALRTTSESQVILFPTLNDALSLPAVRKGMVPYVRKWPDWMTAYISNAITSVKNPANVADLLLRAGKYPQTDETKDLADALLAQLAVKTQFGAFRQFYVSLPGTSANTLTSAVMDANTVNLPYAGAAWQLTESPAIGGSFVKAEAGNRFALQAFAGSGERGAVMTKILFLKPGRYRLSARYAAEESASDGEIRWDMNCPTVKETGNMGFVTSKVQKGDSAATLDFTVGPNCAAQQIIFSLAGGSSQIGAEITLRSINIARLSALD